MHTLDPKGVVASGAKYAWEVVVLMLEGIERSDVHMDKMVEG